MRRHLLLLLSGLLGGCSCVSTIVGDAGGVDASSVRDATIESDTPSFDAPIVPRPPPPWNPPFPLDDEVGWRESVDLPCSPFAGRGYAGVVWSDDRGVFGLTGTLNNPLALDPPFPDGVSLYHNDGSGWLEWHRVPFEPGSGGARRISGAPNGAIYLWNGGCPMQRVTGVGSVACVHDSSEVSGAYFYADEVGVVAVNSPATVSTYDHGVVDSVMTLESTELPIGIWADEGSTVVGTAARVMAGARTGPLASISDAAPAGPYTAFFARGRSDVWVATQGPPVRLLHYDGTGWRATDALNADAPVEGIWGDDSAIWYFSGRTFARVRSDAVESIFEIGPEYPAAITSIAGNSARGEVYLSVLDDTFVGYACGSTFFVVYDGTTLRRF